MQAYREGNMNLGKRTIDLAIYSNKYAGDDVENYFNQVSDWLKWSASVGWDAETCIDAFPEMLDGDLKRMFYRVREQGARSHYDPNHDDANTEEGLKRLLEAFFMEWVDHPAPANALQARILQFAWKNYKDDPKEMKHRLQDLWKLVDEFPSPVAFTRATNRDKLFSIWNGLTEGARDYIQEELNQDPFDEATGGVGEWDWTELLDTVRTYWTREYKNKANKKDRQQSGNKRDRDDDDNEDEEKGNNKRRKNGRKRDNRKSNGGRNNGGDDNNGGGKLTGSNFQKPCPHHTNLAKNHTYGDCIYCPTGSNFKPEAAKKFYENGRNGKPAPDWWKKTYERRVLRKSPPEKEQVQQQFQVQQIQQPQGQVYYAGPPVGQQLPPAPAAATASYFAAPPGQVAPTFATGTSASATTSNQNGTFRMASDASGNKYFVPL